MALTLEEIKGYLKLLDEYTLMEFFVEQGISSEDIVEKLEDFILENYEQIEVEVSEEIYQGTQGFPE